MREVWLYGVVEPGGEVSATGLRDELAKVPQSERLLVRINSPGGSVFEATAIHTQLSQWPAGVDVQVDGLAASAASYIATVGRTVTMARDAMLMIHDAWGVTVGNADDHQAAAGVLDTVSQGIVTAYASKSGKSRAEVRAAMKAETWFTAAGAIEFGLADLALGDDGKPMSASRAKLAEYQQRLDEMARV